MFYLFVREDSHWIRVGKPQGYENAEEAKLAAEKCVDDALPQNSVWVMKPIASAHLAGDGGTYIQER